MDAGAEPPDVQFSKQHDRMLAMRRAQETSPSPSQLGSSRDDGSDYESEHSSVDHIGNARMNQLKLDLLAGKSAPVVHDYPAPVVPPPHRHEIPGYLVYSNKPPSALSRTLNSSLGRLMTFTITIVLFFGAAFGLREVQEPVSRLKGDHLVWLFEAVACLLVLYSCVPMLSEKAGMHPRTSGWKPYLVFYRCSFAVATPAFILIYMGIGAQYGHGEPDGVAGEVLVSELTPMSGRYFEAADGFVALNLTKGIWKTVTRSEHGGFGQRRVSRYKDAELLINTEPFTGLSEPTVPPGALSLWVIAPIFDAWKPCATKYRISSTCLGRNPPRGWAIIKTQSICHDLAILACQPAEPVLRPFYKCSTENIDGRTALGEVGGLCGRIVMPPPQPVMDELGALLLAEQWPKAVMPNSTVPWIDVTPDPCIAKPADCLSHWNLLGILGASLSAITVICIIVPAVLDWKVDNRIREARRFWDDPTRV